MVKSPDGINVGLDMTSRKACVFEDISEAIQNKTEGVN